MGDSAAGCHEYCGQRAGCGGVYYDSLHGCGLYFGEGLTQCIGCADWGTQYYWCAMVPCDGERRQLYLPMTSTIVDVTAGDRAQLAISTSGFFLTPVLGQCAVRQTRAAQFAGEGNDQQIQVSGNPTSMFLSNSGTFAAWIFPTAHPPGGGCGCEPIMTNGRSGAWCPTHQVDLKQDSSGQLKARCGAMCHAQATSATAIPLNRWVHVACTWHENEGIVIYINGQRDAVNPDTSGLFQIPNAGPTIGMEPGYHRRFDGYIGDVQFWNVALGKGQMQALACHNPCVPPSSALPAPCTNGATCNAVTQVVGGDYTCSCAAGYSGTNCATNINECVPAPCQNSAACTDGINTYSCTCVAGYSGTNCATNINECAPAPCLNGAACIDGINTYICSCATLSSPNTRPNAPWPRALPPRN
jgi:hypothetical protein